MTKEFIALKERLKALQLIKSQFHSNEYALISLVYWSTHTEVDLNIYADILNKITDHENMLSPVRRERHFFAALLCNLFNSTDDIYDEIRRIESAEGEYHLLHIPKCSLMSVFRKATEHEGGTLTLSERLKYVRKRHMFLVNGDLKPFLMSSLIDEAALEKSDVIYTGLKKHHFTAGRSMLWLSLMLCTMKESAEALIEMASKVQKELAGLGCDIGVCGYILIGYICQTGQSVECLDAYVDTWIPLVRKEEEWQELDMEIMLFFTINRVWLSKAHRMSEREIYRYILVLHQMMVNSERQKVAVTAI